MTKTWIQTSLEYEIALHGGKIACRNAKGKEIKSLPKKVKDLPETQQLVELKEWLVKRNTSIEQTIETHLQRSLPLLTSILKVLWRDQMWQDCLKNLMIAPISGETVDLESCGFLQEINEKGIGIINVDGETSWLQTDAVVIPHPVVLPELSDLRELATELKLQQKTLQLFREIWICHTTDKEEMEKKEIVAYSLGTFEQLFFAINHCKNLGYKVSGGYATCPIWENGSLIEARYWIGADYPDAETETGELLWVDERGKSLALKDVGLVAYSEGHRMASSIFSKRKKDDEKNAFVLPSPVAENPNPLSQLPLLSSLDIVQAHGTVATSEKFSKKHNCDHVEARIYQHPAIPNDFVVLTTAKLSRGDDAFMEYFGFCCNTTVKKLGKRINRTMGFPEWPLVNDSKNAKYALKILKEFQKEAKKIKSKPGHAKTGFDEIAKKLDKTTPHFLPSFYEEIGRRFIQEGNRTYASQYLGKAREAEKVYSLKIDENVRREVFLEFALSGAVTTGLLKEYAKELQKTYPPLKAYQYFLELCIKRTCGGVPPFKGMGKILTGIAKGSKKNIAKLEIEFLEGVIDAPILTKAPLDFWQYYRQTLITICKKDIDVRARVLYLFPMASTDAANYQYWFQLLEEVKAIDLLKDQKMRTKYNICPISWLQSAIAYSCQTSYYSKKNTPDAIFDIIRKYQSVFSKQGKEITASKTFKKWRYARVGYAKVDLIDILLECKIKIDLDIDINLEFEEWLQSEKSKNRKRPLEYIAQNKQFFILLEQQLSSVLKGNPEQLAKREKDLFNEPILRKIIENFLCKKIESLQKSYVFNYVNCANLLIGMLTPATPKLYPKIKKVLMNISPVASITNNIKKFIVAEYGFSHLDTLLKNTKDAEVILSGIFPYLAVYNAGKVTVLSTEGIVYEHDVIIPKGFEYEKSFYINDDLVVLFRKDWSNYACYWASRSKKIFSSNQGRYETIYGLDNFPHLYEPTLHSFFLTPGSDEVNLNLLSGSIIFDGETYWKQEYSHEKQKYMFVEWCPKTNKKGRFSAPKFFNDLEAGEQWERGCVYNSLPKSIKNSILGQTKNMWGYSLKKGKTQTLKCIDGKKYIFNDKERPQALIAHGYKKEIFALFPRYRASTCENTKGEVLGTWNKNQKIPISWWHLFELRDPSSSKNLRKIKQEQIEKIYKKCQKIAEESDDKKRKQNLKNCIAKEITTVKNPFIVEEITELVQTAIFSEKNLLSTVTKKEQAFLDNVQFSNALRMLNCDDRIYGADNDILSSIDKVKKFFNGSQKEMTIPSCSTLWNKYLGSLNALCFFSLSPILTKEEKENLLSFIENITWILPKKKELKLKTYVTDCKINDAEKYLQHKFLLKKEKDFFQFVSFYHSYRRSGSLTGYICEISEGDDIRLPQGHSLIQKIHAPQANSKNLIKMIDVCRKKENFTLNEETVALFCGETGLSRAGTLFALSMKYARHFTQREDIFKSSISIKSKELKIGLGKIEMNLDRLNQIYGTATNIYSKKSKNTDLEVTQEIAKRWNNVVGKRHEVPISLLDKARRKLQHLYLDHHDFFLILNGSITDHPYLKDGSWSLDDKYELQPQDNTAFSVSDLKRFCCILPWLHLELASGDIMYSKVNELHTQLQQRLSSKSLYIQVLNRYVYDKKDATLELIEQLLGKCKTKKDKKYVWKKDGFYATWPQYCFNFYVCPQVFKDFDLLEKLKAILTSDYEYSNYLPYVKYTLSSSFKKLVERIKNSPIPKGKYEANPLYSAPKIVKKIEKKYKLSQDAAILYLQILTLAEPTKANILMWNEWKSAYFKKVATELCSKNLLLEAKRKRAGREYFLPGGWLDLKAPYLPIEVWKLPLYEVTYNENLQTPLQLIVPLKPVHELFEEVFSRINSGDVPKWEKV